MKDDRVYVKYIRDCLVRIKQYTRGGRDEFLTTSIVQDAVLRNLQTLTESTQRISAKLKSQFPKVNWGNVAKFRNVLVHGYLHLDLEIVWRIIQENLPELRRSINKMLRLGRPDAAKAKKSTSAKRKK